MTQPTKPSEPSTDKQIGERAKLRILSLRQKVKKMQRDIVVAEETIRMLEELTREPPESP